MLNIRRENVLFEKRLHHFFEVVLPLCAMWFGFVLMFVPGMQVRKLVHSCYQERVWVQVIIYGDAVALAGVRRTVIAKLCVAVARDLKLAFKVINPPADQGSSIRRKVPF